MSWNYKRWFRCADSSSARWGAVVLVAMMLAGPSSVAQSGARSASFVERLEAVEGHIDRSRRHTAELRDELDATGAELRRDAAPLDTADRARRRVKRKVAAQLVAWEKAHRQLARAERYLAPGQASDTQTLLAAAQSDALRARMDDIGVLQTIAVDVRRTRELVGERAGLTVDLAQSAADAQAAEDSRKKLVDSANEPKNRKKVDRELERADEELQSSLGMLLKNDTGRDFHRLKGTLRPPVSREVTFPYGPRKQKGSMSYVRHTGLTWKLPEGTPVAAVAGGLVVFAGRFEGFGKMVIVDHGQEYHSLYAHLGELDVEVGEKVKRGGRVGKSGQTGSFEGPKLYFELRKNGQPINPTPWFIQP